MSWRDRLQRLHQERIDQQLWRTRTGLGSPQGRLVKVNGKSLINFCSNDYLGLANHPEVINAACEATRRWGSGSGASHLTCGHLEIHEFLESKLASLIGAEKAVVFSTGYMANLALPQTFLDRHGLLLEDKLNHASLIDAGQLCVAKLKRYPHLDFETVDQLLSKSNADQKMVMTDGIFSMDGDIAPVRELDEICKRQDALLVVDDAHGFGLMGDRGAGCLQQSDISISDHVMMMGTLGKSAGCFGAFVAGDSDLIESLVQFARPYIYTTALPPAVIGAAIRSIELFRKEAWRREKLHANIAYFKNSVAKNNLTTLASSTAIQPIIVGDAEKAISLSSRLQSSGILVAAIRPPTVPAGTAQLRVTLSAEHEFADIDLLLNGLLSIGVDSLTGEAAI